MSLILHNYFRSPTSIRVCIALAMKGVDYEYASYALIERRRCTGNEVVNACLELPEFVAGLLENQPDAV